VTPPATLVKPPATLLAPGWSDTAAVLEPARRFLMDAGWPGDHLRCVSFRRRYGSNREHAEELAGAVDELRARSGSERIAVVAHSMGGLALRYYLTHLGGQAAVHTAVFVATPHRGTWLAWLAWGAGGGEMRPRSRFLRELEERQLPREVRTVCISTSVDLRVMPGSSTRLEGAECHRVRVPGHAGMLRHGPTLRLVRDVLLHAPRSQAHP
jgi:triacylglycerol lipase